ncbi:MAG: TrkH family potassium uptake protein [Clostridiales bacterium]|nr:TrkH family potassium uptake protein [Clostridiales bacterium]MDU3244100.1 TrkH family potassium uptake protein [Clostridiales bacterium]
MNYAMIRYMLGYICYFEAVFLALPCIVSIVYKEKSGFSFAAIMLLCAAVGFTMTFKKPKDRTMFAKEGLVTVALSWIILSIFGAVPFVISGEIPSMTDAFFETVSGFTTTGASILTNVEGLSQTALFWRSFTHWVGGMGVLVFILAIIPTKSDSGIHLMRAESPGPSVNKLVPKVRTTAMILYGIYLGMTVVEIVFLLVGGMPLFDSLTIAFGTAGTGGFAIKNDSIASYSTYLQGVVTVFMIMFGINFHVYYLFLVKRPKEALRTGEMWAYLGIIGTSVLVIAFSVRDMFPSFFMALHQSAFQVGSIITTTGYATVDYEAWPEIARTILVLLMFIGACAGSTGGGIKVSRIIILFKGVKKEITMISHPRSIKKVKIDGRLVEHDVVRSVNAFLVIYAVIFVISLMIISLDNMDMTTNFTAIAATLNNVGPGLGIVGPTGNYAAFSDLSKLVMSFDMLAGRLELLPMLILFVPSTWKW